MTVYWTNAGLGYNQTAYLVRIKKSTNGYDYLCIETSRIYGDNDTYAVGKIVKDLEDTYVEEIHFAISNSELAQTFLGRYFFDNFDYEEYNR